MKYARKILLATTAIVTLASAEPVEAGPIVTAVLATVGAAGGLGGLATFTYFGLAPGVLSVMASIAVRAGLGFALMALNEPPGSPAARYTGQDRGAALPRAIIYGNPRVGGAVVYEAKSGTNNKYFHQIIAFAGHEVDSFQALYLDNQIVTLDGSNFVTSPSKYNNGTDYYVRITTHLGTDNQSADSDAVSELSEWTNDHKLSGIAYAHIRFERVPAGDPTGAYEGRLPQLTARIKGKPVYDPRDGSTAYSENPALCLRDYLTNDRYGLKIPTSRIDDTVFGTAADACEENHTLYDNPEDGLTVTDTYADGDVINNADIDGTQDLFWCCDAILGASDSGLIWEKGSNSHGAFFGTDGANLVFAVGSNTSDEKAEISIPFTNTDLSKYLGLPVTFMGEIDVSNDSIRLFMWIEEDELLITLGSAAAVGSWSNDWSHNNNGGVGSSSSAVFGSYDEGDFTGTINEMRCYDGSLAPTFTTSTVDRYTCVGSVLSDVRPRDILLHLTASMGGYVWQFGGKWACRAAVWDSPTDTLTEDDMRSPPEVSTALPLRDTYNTVIGTYIGNVTEWEASDFTPVTYETFLSKDDYIERVSDLPLYFTDTEEMARRLARIKLKQIRKGMTLTGTFGLKCLKYTIGDVFTLNSNGGSSEELAKWHGHQFEVVNWKLVSHAPVNRDNPDDIEMAVSMILRETASSVYDETAVT